MGELELHILEGKQWGPFCVSPCEQHPPVLHRKQAAPVHYLNLQVGVAVRNVPGAGRATYATRALKKGGYLHHEQPMAYSICKAVGT